MTRSFLRLVARFGRDESGVFAILFGLMAIVLIALGGAVVDYVSLEQTRTRAQVALDAAALALQPEIFTTGRTQDQLKADIKAAAEGLLDDRVGNAETAEIEDVQIDAEEGTLLLQAHLTVPTVFVSLVGVQQMDARLVAEATRKMLDLEVTMVLDNSGSMASFQRMTYLKQAAKCATNILYFTDVDATCEPVDASEPSEKVSMSIVPFTMMVNVGTQFSNATWLDWTGASSVAKLNFDNDDNDSNQFTGLVDRRNLFAQTHTTWRGCVEARRAPNDTTDVAPTTPDTKFVPLFAPDTVGGYNNYVTDVDGNCPVKTCTRVRTQNNTKYYRQIGSTVEERSSSCIPQNAVRLSETTNNNTTTTVYSLLSERELQERMCKYNNTHPTDASDKGPNAYCPEVSVLPLTHDVGQVIDRIDDMRANGGTNIQQGALWGMLSLTPGEPLTEGKARQDSAVSKVMIIMTDGFNEPDYRSYSDTMNGTAIYFSWGFRKDGRLADTDGFANNENEYAALNSKAAMTAVMDQKTVATCNNAKAAGIEVYTIGLSSPSPEATAMLTACSSGAGHYFFPNNPSELENVFRAIAGQLAALRLAR